MYRAFRSINDERQAIYRWQTMKNVGRRSRFDLLRSNLEVRCRTRPTCATISASAVGRQVTCRDNSCANSNTERDNLERRSDIRRALPSTTSNVINRRSVESHCNWRRSIGAPDTNLTQRSIKCCYWRNSPWPDFVNFEPLKEKRCSGEGTTRTHHWRSIESIRL